MRNNWENKRKGIMEEQQLKKLFGKRVREIRKSRHLTQEKLSEIIEMDPQHFCKMENGTHFPSSKNLVKIAQALNVSVCDLFDFEKSDNQLLDDISLKLKNMPPQELEFVKSIIMSLEKLNKQ